jgi:hypothetical protein
MANIEEERESESEVACSRVGGKPCEGDATESWNRPPDGRRSMGF